MGEEDVSQPRRIVIVGGVAGGANAATRARRLDEHAEILLLEQGRHVAFANCGLPYYIGGEIADREALLASDAERLRRRHRIDVRTECEVTRIDREARRVHGHDHRSGEDFVEPYDALILSPGATPVVPPFEGADASRVFTLRTLEDADAIVESLDARPSSNAVVVGAGYIGLEMVEQLYRRGARVALVELQDQVMPLLDVPMARAIEETLRRHGVELHLGDGIARILTDDGGSARAVELDSGVRLPADFVLLGIGVAPDNRLAKDAGLALGEDGRIATDRSQRSLSDADIYAIGDVAQVPFGPTGKPKGVALAGPANRAARVAATHAITGSGDPMPPVQGTSVVRVFDRTAAATGLGLEAATDAGLDALAVFVVAPHHVAYYPGAEPLTLELVYERDSERVLGAQAVGGPGVDKRIDVIATAMHFGATIRDLAAVDLCYAPPYGAAKDPVHMVAFAACNERDGRVHFVHPGADLDGLQVVDVRSPEEVAEAPLAGAPHARPIPLDELRDRLGELDPHATTVTSCASGKRSYEAARILAQRGFASVFDLTGAAILRRRALAGEAAQNE